MAWTSKVWTGFAPLKSVSRGQRQQRRLAEVLQEAYILADTRGGLPSIRLVRMVLLRVPQADEPSSFGNDGEQDVPQACCKE